MAPPAFEIDSIFDINFQALSGSFFRVLSPEYTVGEVWAVLRDGIQEIRRIASAASNPESWIVSSTYIDVPMLETIGEFYMDFLYSRQN